LEVRVVLIDHRVLLAVLETLANPRQGSVPQSVLEAKQVLEIDPSRRKPQPLIDSTHRVRIN
jgi:hypothetical protein